MSDRIKTKNLREKSFSRKLSQRILLRYFATLIAFYSAVLIVFFGAQALLLQKTWYGNEPFYDLLIFISNHRYGVIIAVFVLGAVAIFIPMWVRTLWYLELMIDEVKDVYEEREVLVEMPEELREVEKQLNQTKLNIRRSEQTAKDAEQRKNDLVVYLAHDLKTPLTSVIGYLTLLQEEKEISKELQEKYLAISLSKAERLEELINEFFEITRFNLTNLSLDLGWINLTRMLEQMVFELEPMLKEKNLQCELHVPPDLMIRCDADKLQRAFDNLLRNAVSYSYENSVIEISVFIDKNDVGIRFKNHGNTIPKDKLERIFEQFFRLDSARASKSGGSGLGLAIAKQIIELHNGRIIASSEDDTVVFEVVLSGVVGKS